MDTSVRSATVALLLCAVTAGAILAQGRPRARELGLQPGPRTPGTRNAITDVAGVKVGQVTLSDGAAVRTGVTAVLAHGGNLFAEKVPGAVFVGNGFGKLAGATQVQELGTIESPIVLTNTLSVGTAVDAVVRWTIARPGNEHVRSVNAIVGETNDGRLNDIRGLHVTREHVARALFDASEGPVEEGAVGAGSGTIAFGWKGGIGTSSRIVSRDTDRWTVGVLVQSNYGGRLTIAGAPVWRELLPARQPDDAGADGSCMIVVATDAPLDARDLERLAARAIFALARTGSTYANGSGDYAIAFSTHLSRRVTPATGPSRRLTPATEPSRRLTPATEPSRRLTPATGPQPRAILPTESLSGLFEAAMDATEEAVYNSLLRATDVTSNGRTVRAVPIEELRNVLKKYGRL